MDLSTVAAEYGSHAFQVKETFKETDIKGNNHLFNSIKTDANSNHGHDSSSLFQVMSASANLEVDNSLFSYSSFKKAMDLRTHSRTPENDDPKRTIFEDAEFFAQNYRYKLLPITFEQVDETIIQSEHNYSLCSLSSGSEPEEDCSRTMDYTQIKEKNYKRRRTKVPEDKEEIIEEADKSEVTSSHEENQQPPEEDSLQAIQPLDLSASQLVQLDKTEPLLVERVGSLELDADEVAQLDSDKENMSGIRVTITRPDEKESYQPCDLFLNDMARLVPWLIDKDCVEVDILDRTCDRHEGALNNRLYYVISEATWGLFQKTNERVILTNDRSLGQPVRKGDDNERPSFLVFDQFSLAKCLAEYCQEIGGCFEYTCVEEKEEEPITLLETKPEVEEKETKTMEENQEKTVRELETSVKNPEEPVKNQEVISNKPESSEKKPKTLATKPEAPFKNQRPQVKKPKTPAKKPDTPQKKTEILEKNSEGSSEKVKLKVKEHKRKPKKKPAKDPKPKKPQKSTSKFETSQKSDKPVIARGRRKRKTSPVEEPPRKRVKLTRVEPEELKRRTRSRKLLEKTETKKPKEKKKMVKQNKKKVTDGRTQDTRTLRSQKGGETKTKTKGPTPPTKTKMKTRGSKKR